MILSAGWRSSVPAQEPGRCDSMDSGLRGRWDDPVYKQLADRLDTVPNGYPATGSGVELKLLAKLFTPEEAATALHLRLSPERAPEIARRTGDDRHERNRLPPTGTGRLHCGRKSRGACSSPIPVRPFFYL